MGESDSFSSYWPKYEEKKKEKKGLISPANSNAGSTFARCQQMPCDRKLVKCASFESVITWHLIKV